MNFGKGGLMKKYTWIDTLKEVLKELSIIPLFALFLAIVLLIAYLLPAGLLKFIPFEVFCALVFIAIFGVLYAIFNIVVVIQKTRAKKGQTTKDKDEHSNL